MKWTFSLIIIFILEVTVFGQNNSGQNTNTIENYFEGTLRYSNMYLDKQTLKAVFDSKMETVFVKGKMYKIKLDNPQGGSLDWQIFNFESNFSYSRKNDSGATYHISDKDPVFVNGKLTFPKTDSPFVEPIMRSKICSEALDTAISFKTEDTTFIISGLKSKLIIMLKNGSAIGQYYYCDTVKMDPVEYRCNRNDLWDMVYMK